MGANIVMCGNLLAGTEETPGEGYHSKDGKWLKRYRGMGCFDVVRMELPGTCLDIGVAVAQGVSGVVQDKGSVHKFLPYLIQGLKHGMQDIGASSVEALRNRLYS